MPGHFRDRTCELLSAALLMGGFAATGCSHGLQHPHAQANCLSLEQPSCSPAEVIVTATLPPETSRAAMIRDTQAVRQEVMANIDGGVHTLDGAVVEGNYQSHILIIFWESAPPNGGPAMAQEILQHVPNVGPILQATRK